MRGRADEKQLRGALPSWNRRLLLPPLLFKHWATVGATERRCVYCSTVIARNSLLIAVVLVSGWYWEHVSVCEAGGQLGPWSSVCLTGWAAASTCANSFYRKLPRGVRNQMLLICRTRSRRTSPFSSSTWKRSLWSEVSFLEVLLLVLHFVLKDREVKLKKRLSFEDKVGLGTNFDIVQLM